MNETGDEFLNRQEEHAKRLDDLAGQLETLSLAELSEKVADLKTFLSSFHHCMWGSGCLETRCSNDLSKHN